VDVAVDQRLVFDFVRQRGHGRGGCCRSHADLQRLASSYSVLHNKAPAASSRSLRIAERGASENCDGLDLQL
jgi:hypothetical protein